jgi:hypothetical protein
MSTQRPAAWPLPRDRLHAPSSSAKFGRIIRIWGQTMVPSAVISTLYFVIFGSLIGARIGQMGGFDYMQYIAPGLIMMAVITNSYGNVVSSFFRYGMLGVSDIDIGAAFAMMLASLVLLFVVCLVLLERGTRIRD